MYVCMSSYVFINRLIVCYLSIHRNRISFQSKESIKLKSKENGITDKWILRDDGIVNTK